MFPCVALLTNEVWISLALCITMYTRLLAIHSNFLLLRMVNLFHTNQTIVNPIHTNQTIVSHHNCNGCLANVRYVRPCIYESPSLPEWYWTDPYLEVFCALICSLIHYVLFIFEKILYPISYYSLQKAASVILVTLYTPRSSLRCNAMHAVFNRDRPCLIALGIHPCKSDFRKLQCKWPCFIVYMFMYI